MGGRTAKALVVGRHVLGLRLEAFHRCPGLDEGAIDREVIVRQEGRDLAMGQDRRHDLARHVRCQQPVAVLREHRWHPDRVINPETHEPAEQQVVLHLLHQLPLGPDREQDLEQTGLDQPLRRDRGAAEINIQMVKIVIETGERIVHDLSELAQRVPRRDAALKIDIAEQRPARLVRAPHDHPPPSSCW